MPNGVEKTVSLLTRSMPNAEQIEWSSFGNDEVRFTWRGATFRVSSESYFTEEVDGHTLVGSDKAALIQQLLRKQMTLEAK